MAFAGDDLAARLAPFLGDAALSATQLEQLERFLELLLKWNARVNLTAVRSPEEIVSRHFGESLFAAVRALDGQRPKNALDLGSGAGFPGVPLAIYDATLPVALVESQNKKATFLKEVVRACKLENATVVAGRAESSQISAELVTMRAVEKFDQTLITAAGLVQPAGRLALLVGENQVPVARELLPGWSADEPVLIPRSKQRVLLVLHKK